MQVAKNKAEEAMNKAFESEQKVETLQEENKLLKERIIQLESQSHRSNLLFDGIAETPNETWETSEEKIKDFLKNKLDIHVNIDFERVHRTGFAGSRKPRTIMAKFSWFKQRDLVWKARTKLKQSNVWITEDFPPEIKRERQILFPIYRSAKTMPGVTSCSLKVNKLFINNKQYTVDTLNDLPEALQPGNICTKSDKAMKVTVFFRKDSLLSNFNTSMPIEIQGNSYNCVEQYYQSEKASHFKDEQRAANILKEKDPRVQKRLGDQIRCSAADNDRWLVQAEKVMEIAVFAKMQQNPLARKVLLNTDDHVIGEASRDAYWGTGVPLHYKNTTNSNTWRGRNVLGSIMCKVRSQLRDSGFQT
jgi:ribA/ribD-fused uncharacterized protein